MDFWVMLGMGFVGGFGLPVVAVVCSSGLVKERREVFVILSWEMVLFMEFWVGEKAVNVFP